MIDFKILELPDIEVSVNDKIGYDKSGYFYHSPESTHAIEVIIRPLTHNCCEALRDLFLTVCPNYDDLLRPVLSKKLKDDMEVTFINKCIVNKVENPVFEEEILFFKNAYEDYKKAADIHISRLAVLGINTSTVNLPELCLPDRCLITTRDYEFMELRIKMLRGNPIYLALT